MSCLHGDVYELDEVPNETHDGKTNSDGFADLCELYKEIAIEYKERVGQRRNNRPFREGFVHLVRNCWATSEREAVTRDVNGPGFPP